MAARSLYANWKKYVLSGCTTAGNQYTTDMMRFVTETQQNF